MSPPAHSPTPRHRLSTALAANLAGKVWLAAFAIVLVPFYVRFLGVESYALIGFYAVVAALTVPLDFGIGGAVQRRAALGARHAHADPLLASFLRTTEILYLVAAAIILVTLLALSPVVAHGWFGPGSLTTSDLMSALLLLGAAVALQFPFGFYTAALLGLERHLEYNAIVIGATTVRGLGALVLISFVPSIVVFFAWQALVTALQTLLAAVLLWRFVPRGPRRFEWRSLRGVRAYTLGLGVAGLLNVAAANADKLALSRLLPLDEYAQYAIATTLAAGVYLLASPVLSVGLPRLTGLSGEREGPEKLRFYHLACQSMTLLVVPAAVFVAVFARDILFVWTHSSSIAAFAAHPTALLALASAAIALNGVPILAYLSQGRSRLSVAAAIAALVVAIPLVVAGALVAGAVGAAAAWLAYNVAFAFVVAFVVHRVLFRGGFVRWALTDTLVPTAVAASLALLARAVQPPGLGTLALLAYLVGAAIVVFVGAALALPDIRRETGRRAPRRLVAALDAALAVVLVPFAAIVALSPLVLPRRRAPGRRAMVVDTAYTLREVKERSLEQAITCRDLAGFFVHVWTVHPLVGASRPDGPEALGRLRVVPFSPRHTVIEAPLTRFSSLRRFPRANFLLAQAALAARLGAIIRRRDVRILRIGDPYYQGILGLTLARLHGCRLVLRVGANQDELYEATGRLAYPRLFRTRAAEQRVARFVLARVDLVAGANRNNADHAIRAGARADRVTLFRYGNVVNPIHFADPKDRPMRASVREEIGLGSRRLLLYVGRLEPVKRAADLIEVLARVLPHVPDAGLVLVGDGSLRERMRERAATLGVVQQVAFVGLRNQAWIAAAAVEASVIVSPHMGRALVETALAGTPMVAYELDWQAELVETGRTGVLVAAGDVGAMAAAIVDLLADDERRRALGAAARERAFNMMAPSRLDAHERRCYEWVLGPRAAAPPQPND